MPSHTFKDSDWRSQSHFGMSINFWQLAENGDSFSLILPETPYLRPFLRSIMTLMKTDLDLSESLVETLAKILGQFLVKEEVYQLDELVTEAAKMHQLLDEDNNFILGANTSEKIVSPNLPPPPTQGSSLSENPVIKSHDKGIQCDVIAEKEISGSDRALEKQKESKSSHPNRRPSRPNEQRKKHQRIQSQYGCQSGTCSDTYASRQNLTAHVKQAHGNLYCAKCKCVFWEGKENHICISGKSYECPDCGKRFNGSKDLKNHSYVHSQEKPFACDMCSKSFSQQSTLSRHRTAVHIGEKKFQCDSCEKSFSLKQYLDKHKRKHSGEKPFVCAHCGLAFSQGGNLGKHVRLIHQMETNFVCKVCGDSFVQQSYLQRHKELANH